ncbi:hypothetical protein TSAR_008462 [Trichomalopsis sarcophagae]|uniref:Uncharacterized protein n=1 Tax=Trichomalopsis sarcophagae TaxID=543379 RepID=A0A232FAH9_9HYME|nr:hypothetical protein TSAR_008462 [Trichomalopsis sarcophagae]
MKFISVRSASISASRINITIQRTFNIPPEPVSHSVPSISSTTNKLPEPITNTASNQLQTDVSTSSSITSINQKKISSQLRSPSLSNIPVIVIPPEPVSHRTSSTFTTTNKVPELITNISSNQLQPDKQISSQPVEDRNMSNSTKENQQIFPVYDNPDIGLYTSKPNMDIQNKTLVFQNCNVTINITPGSHNMKTIRTDQKLVQTEY